jgi:hypothetical protein
MTSHFNDADEGFCIVVRFVQERTQTAGPLELVRPAESLKHAWGGFFSGFFIAWPEQVEQKREHTISMSNWGEATMGIEPRTWCWYRNGEGEGHGSTSGSGALGPGE